MTNEILHVLDVFDVSTNGSNFGPVRNKLERLLTSTDEYFCS